LGRKTNEVFVGLATNSFGYNAAGDLLTLRDGKNQVTTWAYNTEGLVTHKWDARGTNILQYLYDPNGRLTNRWSAAKGNTRYLYDPLGNLTNVDYAVSADLRFQYDALYRLTNMVDAAGTTAYSYWPAGGLKTENGPWASDIITCTNNAAGMRQSLTVEQPSGSWQVSYAYDPAKRLTNLASPAGTFAYTYRGAGLLWTNLALPNTAAITNDYDGMARLRWRFAGASSGFAGASPGQAPASLALRRGKLRLCWRFAGASSGFVSSRKVGLWRSAGGDRRDWGHYDCY
jgi:YD repeat-containing protein